MYQCADSSSRSYWREHCFRKTAVGEGAQHECMAAESTAVAIASRALLPASNLWCVLSLRLVCTRVVCTLSWSRFMRPPNFQENGIRFHVLERLRKYSSRFEVLNKIEPKTHILNTSYFRVRVNLTQGGCLTDTESKVVLVRQEGANIARTALRYIDSKYGAVLSCSFARVDRPQRLAHEAAQTGQKMYMRAHTLQAACFKFRAGLGYN